LSVAESNRPIAAEITGRLPELQAAIERRLNERLKDALTAGASAGMPSSRGRTQTSGSGRK